MGNFGSLTIPQIAEVGNLALALGLAVSVYVVFAAVFSQLKRRGEFFASARYGIYVITGLTTLAVAILEWALLTHQFRFEYVANHVSSDQPLLYTISALWGGQEGSLLFWVWLLALFGAVVLIQHLGQTNHLIPWVIAFIAFTDAFFFSLLVFISSPFALLAQTPVDGIGLNPLLQDPGMFIHPVTQYLGYVGFTVPFAFAMAALVTGDLGYAWIRTTRRWALFAWLFLSLGLLFGMRWAYVELGWGGYWGWDPVENAALIPWLTGAAYLHSVMIQEKRGMLKVWNLVLILLTFLLSILGTFITRSGVIQSVHAFGVSSMGPLFLAYIAAVLIVFAYLLYLRLDQLKEENRLDSMWSREATFLLNNLILLGAAVATLWGTIFPMISELLAGKQITVAAPFFNQVNGPILLALVLLMGVCTLIGWRRASPQHLVRNFVPPLVVAAITTLGSVVSGVRDVYGLIAFAASAFVLTTILLEFYRGARARMRMYQENVAVAPVQLVNKNRRRYGGYIVHIGVMLAAIGIVGSTFLQTSVQKNVAPGESVALGPYTMQFQKLFMTSESNAQVIAADLIVFENGNRIDTLRPQKAYYPAADQMTTEVAVRTTLREDLYVILAGWNDDGSATLKVIINPLVVWLWIGFIVFIIGALIAMLPDPREAQAVERVRAEKVLAGAIVQ
ncbi:MAG: heme lyase CcmF/NrfE family subunit [Chloroflexi bacterium]|nr:heme lyase CcmF/NrfE family subunit [Chloroflexota bacterium]